MIRPTFWRVFLLFGGLALAAAPACAQLALPGAAPPRPGRNAGRGRPSRKSRAAPRRATRHAKSDLTSAEGVESIDGRPLMLNGGAGLLQLSGQGETLQVDKLSLAGEGVSDASQRCVVNIVGEKPIAATSDGRPDGLERYEVDVPACPFAFDVLDGAVLVPSQITACVFKAADCQTSPSGLWGPDGGSLDGGRRGDRQTAHPGRERDGPRAARARRARQGQRRRRQLVQEQGGFAGERDDICRDYVKEAAHGFCAASVTAARAALLEARLAALPSDESRQERQVREARQAQEAQARGGRRASKRRNRAG